MDLKKLTSTIITIILLLLCIVTALVGKYYLLTLSFCLVGVFHLFRRLLEQKYGLCFWLFTWIYFCVFFVFQFTIRMIWPILNNLSYTVNRELPSFYCYSLDSASIQLLLKYVGIFFVIGIGLLLGGGSKHPKTLQIQQVLSRKYIKDLSGRILLLVGIGYILKWVFLIFYYNPDYHANVDYGLLGYIFLLFHPDCIFIVGFFFLLSFWEYIPSVNKIALILLLVSTSAGSFITGSRAFLMTLAIYFALFYLSPFQKMKTSIKTFWLFSSLLIISFLIFPVITNIKNRLPLRSGNTFEASSYMEIINRLNGVDVAFLIHNPEDFRTSKYITILSDLKHCLNKMVPGDPFDNAFDAPVVFRTDYRGISLQQSLESYHSDVFFIFNMPFIYWDGVFALILLFILAFLYVQALKRVKVTRIRHFVIIVPFSMLMLTQVIGGMSVGRILLVLYYAFLNYVCFSFVLFSTLTPKHTKHNFSAKPSVAYV